MHLHTHILVSKTWVRFPSCQPELLGLQKPCNTFSSLYPEPGSSSKWPFSSLLSLPQIPLALFKKKASKTASSKTRITTAKSKLLYTLSWSRPHPSNGFTEEQGWREGKSIHASSSIFLCLANFCFVLANFLVCTHNLVIPFLFEYIFLVLYQPTFFVTNFAHLPQDGKIKIPKSLFISLPLTNSSMKLCDPKMTLEDMLKFLYHRRIISAKNFQVVIFI